MREALPEAAVPASVMFVSNLGKSTRMKPPAPMQGLALSAIGAAVLLACTAAAADRPGAASGAAIKAPASAPGSYVTGDFHNHTTCTDGTLSLKKLVDKSAGTFGLDWFVQSGHGGTSTRNCTLAEDPFEPVPPALGLGAAETIAAKGQEAASGKGPNQSWSATIGNAAIKGDVSGTEALRRMWRWQTIQEFVYPVIEQESRERNKPIFVGLEQTVPGHDHASTSVIDGQLPAGGNGNATALAQYEYCFDRGDADKSRGAANQWNCAVTGSAHNGLLDPLAKKILVATGAGSGTAGHAKTVEGIKWLAEHHPQTSYFIPAHLERAGAFHADGNKGYNIEHLRNFNNAAPTVAFGFESMPGHQADPERGGYRSSAAGGGTYGGVGIYAAQIGGVWDALLGEGRNWFFFASSDFHNRGSFGPDQRESTADFFPGEYTKDHVMARSTGARPDIRAIVDGLRSGNSFVANGGLIDRLSFVVCAANAVGAGKLDIAAAGAAAGNTALAMKGCATMGQKLVVRPGTDLIVSVVLRDPPGKNNSPYSFPNPSLRQVGMLQPLDAPVLDHVDLIGGKVSGYVDPANTDAYAGLVGSPAASNPSARLLKTFSAANWRARADGTRIFSYRIPAVKASQYLRLRGTNLPAATPFETDASGNPLLDYGSAGRIPCADAACPAHMSIANGIKTSSFDVAAWSDLWFYANPVFIEVSGSTRIAGIRDSARR